VSATAAYRHFASHADLIREVKERCQATLAGYMDEELTRTPPADDPEVEAVRRLRALGTGYLRFAIAEPGLFRTAFCHTEAVTSLPFGEWESAAYDKLSGELDEMARLGLIHPEARPLAEMFAWATVHGMANLLVDGPLAGMPDDVREAALNRTMNAIVDGLCQRPWSREHPST
jgi:AcrR family transcriptional regulator